MKNENSNKAMIIHFAVNSKRDVRISAGQKKYRVEYIRSGEQYCQYLANGFGWTAPDARIYYLDGRKKEIFINK